jgi:high-affinity nickel-transport protein
VLGLWNVVASFRNVPGSVPVHSHAHPHGDYVHTHPHSHVPETHPHAGDQTPLAGIDRRLGKSELYQSMRPLVIGIVHGLAGSAAVALLILATIRNSAWAIVYLLVFGVGTIAGMMLITMSIASTFRLVGARFQSFSQRLGMASGLLSLAFGLFLAYQIGIVQGLFTSHPQWTPH